MMNCLTSGSPMSRMAVGSPSSFSHLRNIPSTSLYHPTVRGDLRSVQLCTSKCWIRTDRSTLDLSISSHLKFRLFAMVIPCLLQAKVSGRQATGGWSETPVKAGGQIGVFAQRKSHLVQWLP